MSLSPLFDIYDPGGLRRLTPSLDENGRPRKPRIEDLLPEEEKQGLLRKLANAGTSGLSAFGYLFDTLGSGVRGVLAGKPASVAGSSDERVSGRDLLRAYGLIGDKDTWSNFAAGLATEIVTDPLTYLNPLSLLGRGAASTAGRVAARANLLDDAAVVARKSGMGIREYLTSKTARDVIGSDAEALNRFGNAARGKGLNPDDLLDSPLAGAMEFRIPGFERGTTIGTGAYTKAAARALDKAGDTLATNPITGAVVNRLTRAFDPSVMERLDPEDQWRAREAWHKSLKAERNMRGEAARKYLDAVNADASFNDQAIQNAIRDTIEANGDPDVIARLQDQASVAKIENTPAWKEYRDWYRQALADAQQRRADLGLETPTLQSVHGTGYMPRQAVRFAVDQTLDPDVPGRLSRRQRAYNRAAAVYSTDDLVGRGRRPYLDIERPSETLRRLMTGDDGARLRDRLFGATPDQMPGILDEAFEALGLDAPYRKFTDSQGNTVESLTQFLADPSLTASERAPAERALRALQSQASSMKVQLGDLLRGADKQFAEKGLGYFDRHTLTDMLRYGSGGARSEANAQVLLDELLKLKSNIPAGAMPGGGHTNLLEGAEKLGFNKARLKSILEAKLPGQNIDELSLPDSALAQLRGVIEAQPNTSLAGEQYDSFTNLFKVGALANPAYHTRNAYSGYLSSLMSGHVSPTQLLKSVVAGLGAGKGKYTDGLMGMDVYSRLKDAPAYRHLAGDPQKLVDQFLVDSARNKLGTGIVSEGALDPAVGAPNLLPGKDTQPDQALLPYLSQLFYDPNRTWSDWATVRGVNPIGALFGRRAPQETRNPWLLLHEQTSRRVEDANRLGLMIELLRQGTDPDAAARQVFKTQVDYSPQAFTNFERKIKSWVPFYSYPRGIAPLVAENMLYRPGGLQQQTIRAISSATQPSETSFTPEHLRQSAAIPLPWSPAENLKRYVNKIDLPYEKLINLFSPGLGNTPSQVATDTLRKTGMNLLGQLNPVVKAPLEMILNRQLYSGRELDDVYSVLERDLGPIGRSLEQLLVNLPGGSKLNSLYRTATDQRLTPAQRAAKIGINNTLGFAVTDVDEKRTMDMAARKTLEDLLKSAPGVRSYESLSVPEEVLTSMLPDQQQLYLLYKTLQSAASRRARQSRDPVEALLNLG